MIDLTPLDVRKKRGDFRRLLRGYDPEEVDTFLELVAERLEDLVKENLGLSERLERAEGQLEALQGREKAVQEALVTAQKLREDVAEQGRREADILRREVEGEMQRHRREAEDEIERRLGEAEGLIQERQRALEDLERNRVKFLKAFRSLLERELDAVEVEESRRPLEEAPLELELRGWSRARLEEEEEEEQEEQEEEAEPGPGVETDVEIQTGTDPLEGLVGDEEGALWSEDEVLGVQDELLSEGPPAAGEAAALAGEESGPAGTGDGEEGEEGVEPSRGPEGWISQDEEESAFQLEGTAIQEEDEDEGREGDTYPETETIPVGEPLFHEERPQDMALEEGLEEPTGSEEVEAEGGEPASTETSTESSTEPTAGEEEDEEEPLWLSFLLKDEGTPGKEPPAESEETSPEDREDGEDRVEASPQGSGEGPAGGLEDGTGEEPVDEEQDPKT